MALPHVNAGQPAKAAEQNDLIDTVNGHTASLSETGTTLTQYDSRLSALEDAPSGAGGDAVGTYFGQWTDANNGAGRVIEATVEGSPGHKGLRMTDINVVSTTPRGCSMSAGTFTAQQPGLWQFNMTAQYIGAGPIRAVFLTLGNADVFSGGARNGIIAGPQMDAQATSCVIRLNANQQVSAYAACWTLRNSVQVWKALSNNFTATWLGP